MKYNTNEQDKSTVINTMFMLVPLDRLVIMLNELEIPTYARKDLNTIKTILMLAPLSRLKAVSMSFITGVKYSNKE